MKHEWIKAALALEYVSGALPDYAARIQICERAQAGLIAAKAERMIWGERDQRDRTIDQRFWWARGGEVLAQNWTTGDFATWIDDTVQAKAFGVSFDFTALSELVPASKQAEALRRISVIGDEEWISASDLLDLMSVKGGPYSAKLLEACQLGKIAGRAMRARRCHRVTYAGPDLHIWGAIEWDVPLYFWRDFATGQRANVDWLLSRFSGHGGNEHSFDDIELQGVHFHRCGLTNLGLEKANADEAPAKSRGGRKPSHDWPAACVHVFGLIYRGELKPRNQADVERAFIDHLTEGDAIPSESTVRPYAKRIWEEAQKA